MPFQSIRPQMDTRYRSAYKMFEHPKDILDIRFSVTKPVRFSSSGFFQAGEDWVHSHRRTDSYEIIIMIKHGLKLEVEGRRYELEEGDMLLIPPGWEHVGFGVALPGTVFFWTHFYIDPEMLMANGDEANEEAFDMTSLEAYQLILPLHMEKLDMGKTTIYCHQICDVNESRAYVPGSTDYLMTALLNEISSQYISKHDELYYGNIQKIMEWIRINYASPISVKDVADHFQYSINYMSAYFSKHVGVSMQKYISMKRVKKACELLLETRDTVIQIAAQVGFKDSKYFLRVFKQYMKQTPTQYRNAFNKTHYNKK